MNVLLAILYCVYVLASGATFSLMWFLFWLFFGLIVILSFFVVILPITLVIVMFCSDEFYEEFKIKLKQFLDKLEKYLFKWGKFKK